MRGSPGFSNEPGNGSYCFQNLFSGERTSLMPVNLKAIDVLRDRWRVTELEIICFSNGFHPGELATKRMLVFVIANLLSSLEISVHSHVR